MGYAAPLDSQQQSEVDDLATAMTDEDLLLEYRLTNSAELFAELVTRYERELFAYLFRFMGRCDGGRGRLSDGISAVASQV